MVQLMLSVAFCVRQRPQPVPFLCDAMREAKSLAAREAELLAEVRQ